MQKLFSQDRAHFLNSQITTSRLVLEPVMAEHAVIFFEKMSDPQIYEWISAKPPPSLEALQTSWKKRESRLSPDQTSAWLNWAIKRTEDGAYVGRLDADINLENVATNIGFVFFPNSWGNGFATESLQAVCKHLEKNGISKIFATVTKGNSASCRVLEKSGFLQHREIPQGDTIRGVVFDEIEYLRSV